jgi:hypothetical protein
MGDSLSSISRVGKKVNGCCKQATALLRGHLKGKSSIWVAQNVERRSGLGQLAIVLGPCPAPSAAKFHLDLAGAAAARNEPALALGADLRRQRRWWRQPAPLDAHLTSGAAKTRNAPSADDQNEARREQRPFGAVSAKAAPASITS